MVEGQQDQRRRRVIISKVSQIPTANAIFPIPTSIFPNGNEAQKMGVVIQATPNEIAIVTM